MNADRAAPLASDSPESVDAERRAHDAFISYSHDDDAQVGRLHRAILRFGLPPWRRSRLDIFLDKEDLEAGHELSDALRRELDTSNYLLVVVSPASAQSPYVDDEIDHWLATRDVKTVIPIIANWQGDRQLSEFDWSGEVLPKALRGLMRAPLAVDFRLLRNRRRPRSNDRPAHREAMASLIGRIDPNRTKEQLVGDEQRRVRAVRTAAAVILAVVSVAVVFAAWSLQRSGERGRAAQVSEAGRLSVEMATAALSDARPDLQLLLGAEAYRIAPTPEAAHALATLLSGKPGAVAFFRGHDAAVLATHAPADGGMLWTLSADGTLARWNLEAADLSTESIAVEPLAAAINGEYVALVLNAGIEIRHLDEPGRVVASADIAATAVDLAANGSVAFGTAEGEVLYAAAASDEVTQIASHSGIVNDVDLLDDGHLLASVGSDGVALLIDTTSGDVARLTSTVNVKNSAFTAVALSPDGATLAAAGLDQQVAIWNVPLRSQTEVILEGTLAAAVDLAFADDGSILIGGDVRGVVAAWDFHAGEPIDWPSLGHVGPVLHIGKIPSRGLLLTGGEDGVVVAWDPKGSRSGLASSLGGDFDADADPLSGSLVIGREGAVVALSDGGQELWRLKPPGTRISAVAVAGSAAVAGTLDGGLVWVELADGAEVSRVDNMHQSRVEDVAFDDNAGRLYSLDSEGSLVASTAQMTETLWSIDVPGARRMSLAPDGYLTLHISDPPFLATYDGSSGDQVAPSVEAAEATTALAYARDTAHTAHATIDGLVAVANPDGSESPVQLVLPDGAVVDLLALSPTGRKAAALTVDGRLGVWDVEAQRMFVPFVPMHAAYEGRALLFASENRMVSVDIRSALVWELDSDRWAELACQRAGRAGTPEEAAEFGIDVAATKGCADNGLGTLLDWAAGARLRPLLPDSLTIEQWIEQVDLRSVITGLMDIQNAYAYDVFVLPTDQMVAECARLAADERLEAALRAFEQAPDSRVADAGTGFAGGLIAVGLSCQELNAAATETAFRDLGAAKLDLAARLAEVPHVDLEELGFVR